MMALYPLFLSELFCIMSRYAQTQTFPVVDASQDVTMTMIEEVGGRTTMYFTRARDTGDSEQDLTLDETTRLLWATGDVNDINQQTINYHGNAASNRRGVSGEITFPTAAECPVVGKNVGFAAMGGLAVFAPCECPRDLYCYNTHPRVINILCLHRYMQLSSYGVAAGSLVECKSKQSQFTAPQDVIC